MRTIVVPLLLAAMAQIAVAREGPVIEEKDPGLAAVEALKNEYDAARNAFFEKYQAAESEEEKQNLFQTDYPQAKSYTSRFLEIVKQYPGQAAARESLVWLVHNSKGMDANRRNALETLATDFIQDEELADVCASLRYESSAEAEEFLRKVYAETPHRGVKGNACYTLAHVIASRADRAQDDEAAAMRKNAKALFVEVVQSFGDVESRRGTLGDSASGDIFEIEQLAIGCEAPDIEGVDLDGVVFKLSDYRGQVVVLDFWGDW